MRRTLSTACLLAFAASPALADTLEPRSLAPEIGVDALTREVANRHLDRDLLSRPYAAVVLGSVDLYDTFPFAESRYVQVVTDPDWNRVLAAGTDGVFAAYDGAGEPLGPLAEPHGIALGVGGALFVADTGNNRIVILDLVQDRDGVRLTAVGAIGGLTRPFDVAHSDRGTPDDPKDDRLYVADTGSNRVIAFAVHEDGWHPVASVGGLGAGPGHFAGPMAVAVGRSDGRTTDRLYVADAHSRCVVQLRDTGDHLQWLGSQRHDLPTVTSLSVDTHGGVYLAGPQAARAVKLNADLTPLDEPALAFARPRSLEIVTTDVRDHREGATGVAQRELEGRALVVETWERGTGIRMVGLGTAVRNLSAARDGTGLQAHFRLTDPASVSLDLVDPVRGGTVARHAAGPLEAGDQTVTIPQHAFTTEVPEGDYTLRLTASSNYEGSREVRAETRVTLDRPLGDGAFRQGAILLGNAPNPFRASTTLRFDLPGTATRDVSLEVFDLQGRLVRPLLREALEPGVHTATWNGRDEAGRPAAAGIYLVRLTVDGETVSGRMVLTR